MPYGWQPPQTVALGAGDYLTITLLHTLHAPAQYGPARGQQHLMRLLAFLEPQTSGGTTDLNQSLRDYTLAARRPGLAFLISDLFSPAGFESGLNQLLSRGYEVTLLHLLAPDELDPPLAGDLRLIDLETNHGQDVSLDAGLPICTVVACKLASGGSTGVRQNAGCATCSHRLSWDELVLDTQAGIVK
jgi:hypothetical protein